MVQEVLDSYKDDPKVQELIAKLSIDPHAESVSHPYNAAQIAQIFLDHVCKLHGAPCSIVSDRGPIFVSLYMTGQKPKEWSKWPPMEEFWYNTNFQSAINMTPFKALYGYELPLPTFELVAQSKVEAVDQMLKDRQIVNKQLKENLVKAQIRMK
uniref:Uncharacterized protein n=1 Tax=Nicotiana tabacum TaxID=4097 RepID=A0A1S4BA98_TOBAC|nr:PREDICTED: uncharacterized protein LOC107806194 [Nicotiana tabacum]